MIEILAQLKEALAKLVVLLTALSSVVAPVGTPILGGVINPIQIDPTPVISKLDRFEVDFSEKVPQEGEMKVEMLKDRPKMILSKWNGEVAMGIDYKKITANATKLQSSNEVKWGTGNEVVHAYKKDADNFEIEIELKSKPATNVFDFTITGAENLDFFYQPELTTEEIAERAFRPENVVGSYAVYHKTKANHRVGNTNYATGKAYHIYRPKAIDANGAETGAELSYTNGALSVTVPQKFLDDAVYPVRVDPTFGYTSIGATDGASFAQNTSDRSAQLGRAWNLGEAGTLDSLHVAAILTGGDVSDTVDFFAAIYREDSAATDSHDRVVGIERTNLSISSTATFYTFTAASQSLTIDDYILAGLGDGADVASASNLVQSRFDAGSSGNIYFEQVNNGYATLKAENPWTEVKATSTNTYSIYATYTATGGAAAPTRKRVIIITE